MPGFGVGAGGSDGAAGVDQGDGVVEAGVVFPADAVFHDHGGNSALVEPGAVFESFVAGGDDSVSAAGKMTTAAPVRRSSGAGMKRYWGRRCR